MKKELLLRLSLLCAAAIATFVSFTFVQSVIAWFCLAPIFYLNRKEPLRGFKNGLFFGIIFSTLTYYWLPGVVSDFAGGSVMAGISAFLLAILLLTLYCMLVNGIGQIIIVKIKASILSGALITASVWVLGELLLSLLFRGMPWLFFYMGSCVARDTFTIQWTSIGGVHLLSFIVITFNYLLAASIQTRQKQPVIIAGCVLLFCIGGGAAVFFLQNDKNSTGTFSIAITAENTDPHIKWQANNGDVLVKKLLAVNKQADALNTDIILWTESAIPWTYRADDDFVKAVLQQVTDTARINLIGINSENDRESVFNSAYAINGKGEVKGRYDKQYLLDLAERPLFSINLPFLSTDGFYAVPGNEATTLPTSKANIGVLICNESTVPAAARDLVKNDADVLVNMTNDGWFSNSPLLIYQHFYSSRMRAVETRRDIAISANNGFSGMIKADGTIADKTKIDEPYIRKFVMTKQEGLTIATRFPLLIFLIVFTGLAVGTVKPKM